MKNSIDLLLDIFVFVLVDEFLKASDHAETGLSATGGTPKLTDAEIIFVFLMACLEHGGNIHKAQNAMLRCGNIRDKLHKSQFNRRLHRLAHEIFALFCLLASFRKAVNKDFAIDSFPLPVCHNIRIRRSRLVRGEDYRGYNASKRVYFYGFKVHCITAADGTIVEFEFFPGRFEDKVAFGLLNFDLPEGSNLFGDKAYNWYIREDELKDIGINFQPVRKTNSKKEDNSYVINWLRKQYRRHIETSFSVLEQLFPRKIHAVTEKGFLLKTVGFILAHNILVMF